jgi:hypothetical protein
MNRYGLLDEDGGTIIKPVGMPLEENGLTPWAPESRTVQVTSA